MQKPFLSIMVHSDQNQALFKRLSLKQLFFAGILGQIWLYCFVIKNVNNHMLASFRQHKLVFQLQEILFHMVDATVRSKAKILVDVKN